MIVQYSELSGLAKRCTCAQEEAERGIREAERFDIIPKIGAELYLAIMANAKAYEELLNGNVTYTDDKGSGLCQGLKTAIAYYAESRICRSNNVQLDKYGANVKQSEYSINADNGQIDAEARYLESCGDKAMDTVMGYINANATSDLYKNFIQAPRMDDRNQFEEIHFLNRD